jgi:hypothetical protein
VNYCANQTKYIFMKKGGVYILEFITKSRKKITVLDEKVPFISIMVASLFFNEHLGLIPLFHITNLYANKEQKWTSFAANSKYCDTE